MVVDDNKQVREGISLGIDWNEYGISKVRAYEDGAKARDDLVDYCPDIVIADIRMPNLDGLELLEEVRKENQKCRYILLSAYSEFEYAQKALRLGADDYILKPVKPRELVELVMKNITSLLEMQKESELYYEVYEKSFIHSILNGDEIENIKKFQEFMEKCLGLRFDEKRAVVGKIKIEQKNLISQKRPITEEETDKIKAILKTNKYISLVDKNNTFIMICPGCSSEMKNHIVAMEIKREFEKINQIFPELIIVVGISKSIGLGKLAEGWKEAEEALEQKYCYKTKVFFSFKEIYPMMKQAIPENLKKSYMEKILEAVKIKKKEDTQRIFKAIYEECREKNYSPREIKKFIEQLYFYLVRHMGMNSSREFEEEVLHSG